MFSGGLNAFRAWRAGRALIQLGIAGGPSVESLANIALQNAVNGATGAARGRVWIAAYDVETGAVAVGRSGASPAAADLDSALLSKLNGIGELGARTNGATGGLGCCAEVNAANKLLQQGSKLENIRFTDAMRPKTGDIIPRCPNCQATFGKY